MWGLQQFMTISHLVFLEALTGLNWEVLFWDSHSSSLLEAGHWIVEGFKGGMTCALTWLAVNVDCEQCVGPRSLMGARHVASSVAWTSCNVESGFQKELYDPLWFSSVTASTLLPEHPISQERGSTRCEPSASELGKHMNICVDFCLLRPGQEICLITCDDSKRQITGGVRRTVHWGEFTSWLRDIYQMQQWLISWKPDLYRSQPFKHRELESAGEKLAFKLPRIVHHMSNHTYGWSQVVLQVCSNILH